MNVLAKGASVLNWWRLARRGRRAGIGVAIGLWLGRNRD